MEIANVVKYNKIPNELTLIPFQKATISKIHTYFSIKNNYHKSYLVNYPMGGGKSYLISLMSLIEKGNVLVLSPSIEIKDLLANKIKQFKETLKSSKKVFELENIKFEKNMITIGTYQLLYSMYKSKKDIFNKIQEEFDLILIDEGHREPSPKWSFCIRSIRKPKILFTATPYRNDFNLFEIEDEAVEIQTYSSLLKTKRNKKPILRKISVNTIDWKQNNTNDFVLKFLSIYHKKCKNSFNAIIRCKNVSDIKKIVNLLNKKHKNIAVGIHSTFTKKDNTNNFYHSYKDAKTSTKRFRIYVHQYKLIEGIDDSNFNLIFFHDDLMNARALVQQIGRILRYKSERNAFVFCNTKSKIKQMWDQYIRFDKTLDKNKPYWGLRRFSEEYLKNINQINYISGSFKEALNFDLPNIKMFNNLLFWKSVNIYAIPKTTKFELLIEDLNIDLASSRKIFKIKKVDLDQNRNDISDFYIVCYISAETSSILKDIFFPELKLEIAGIFKIKDNLYSYSSNNISFPSLKEHLNQTKFSSIKNIIQSNPIFSQINLNNMDISDSAIRQRAIRALNLNESLSSNLDFSFFLTHFTFKDNNKRAYLGIKNSKITEYTSKQLSGDEFISWLVQTNEMLIKSKSKHIDFFDRFAKVVDNPPLKLKPAQILLEPPSDDESNDFSDILNHIEKSFQLTDSGDDTNYFEGQLKNYNFKILLKKIHSHRFELIINKLKKQDGASIANLHDLFKKFIEKLNSKQLFRISFSGENIIYSIENYFSMNSLKGMDSIITADKNIKTSWEEKGKIVSRKFETSLFKYIFDYKSNSRNSALHKELKGIDFLVCDDRGGRDPEIADFIAVQNDANNQRIILIHCKSKKNKETQATALYDVTSQVIKNLRYINPFSKKLSGKESRFSSHLKLNGSKISRIKPCKGQRGNLAEKFTREYDLLLSDPKTIKEIWIVMGGGAIASQLKQSLEKDNVPDYLTQARYIIYTTWAAVSSASAKFTIFCPNSKD